MATAVVTGGAGFIGSHIVDELRSQSYEVIVIDDLSSGVRSNLQSEVEFHELDIRSDETRELLRTREPNMIVHAAAQISVRQSMDDPMFDSLVNVSGPINILQAFQGKSLPYVVFISTGGAILASGCRSTM